MASTLEILTRERNEPVMPCSLVRAPSSVAASFDDLRIGMPETAIGKEALSEATPQGTQGA